MNYEALARLWCSLVHAGRMWPIHGIYRCSECLREYPVPWEDRPSAMMPKAQSVPALRVPASRAA